MTERIYEGVLDEAAIRRWAFDEGLELALQDEELRVYQRHLIPTLVSLADDPACPKARYILEILDSTSKASVLRGDERSLIEVGEIADHAARASDAELRNFSTLLRRLLDYRAGVGPVSAELALKMGQELLTGYSRQAEISIAGETPTTWEVELSVPRQPWEVQLSDHPPPIYRERLFIDKGSGRFRFSNRQGPEPPCTIF